MTLAHHGAGQPLDAHMIDTAAHSGAGLAATADFAQERLIVPPGSVLAASALATWYVANNATLLRFCIPRKGTYRYVNLYAGVLSGNYEVGVVALAPSSATAMQAGAPLASTGSVAMSGLTTNAANQIDLGSFNLPAGDYGMYLWCDNTTATFLHGLATGLTASRMLLNCSIAGGLNAHGAITVSATTRWVSGLTLEAAT